MRNTIRSRVYRYGLIFLALFVASMAAMFLSLYLLLAAQFEDLLDDEIIHEVEGISRRYSADDEHRMIADLDLFLNGHPGYNGIYLLENAQGEILAGNLDFWPDMTMEPGRISVFAYRDPHAEKEPPTLVRGTVCPLPGGHRLLVGRNFTRSRDIQRLLRRNAGIGLLLTIVLGLVAATLSALGLSRRLERINRTTVEILDAGLDVRVPLNGSGDEFDRLAINLNRMLNRIKRLMESIEGVTDVIAHDLRSPLNRMKSRLEVGLMSERSPNDYREILVGNMEDTDRLLSTFNSLLTIAKVRASSTQAGFQTVDLAQVLQETMEFYGPVAEEKEQAMVVEAAGPVPVWGNPDLLVQTLFNLVDNAIKYSPEGSFITLTAARESSACVALVRDNGPGIPPEFRSRAFERFVRLETSEGSAGQGLGLSLVQVVMDLHGGSVTLVDGEPGLIVRLEFPKPESRSAT